MQRLDSQIDHDKRLFLRPTIKFAIQLQLQLQLIIIHSLPDYTIYYEILSDV